MKNWFDKRNLPDDLTGLSFKHCYGDEPRATYTVDRRNGTKEWIVNKSTTNLYISLNDTGLRLCLENGTFVITRPEGWEFEGEEAPQVDPVQEVIEI